MYSSNYFREDIFSTNYASLAKAIVHKYSPSRVIEFGCGPGHLTKELSNLGISVTAVDGFSKPDFSGFSNVTFSPLNLNDQAAVISFVADISDYDLAICTEVAEHLDPSASETLVSALTKVAKTVIFSAAIPEQGGHGHINCQPREFWHKLFKSHNFIVRDSLRKNLRLEKNLAIWYQLNVLDYVHISRLGNDEYDTIIENLIASESYSSSLYYKTNTLSHIQHAYLNYPIVKQYFSLRNFLKKLAK